MVNSINTSVNFQATVTQPKERDIKSQTKTKSTANSATLNQQPNYKKLGTIALGIAILLTGIIKHKAIGDFIKSLGKNAEKKTSTDGFTIAEDYPDWKPKTKHKKQENPLKPIIDENGNILGYRNPAIDKNEKFSKFEEII